MARAGLRLLVVAFAAATLWWMWTPGHASAQALLPSGNSVFTGLTGGSYPAFEHEVGKDASVNGVFVTWGRSFEQAFGEAHYNHARLMLHISTAKGYGAPEQI